MLHHPQDRQQTSVLLPSDLLPTNLLRFPRNLDLGRSPRLSPLLLEKIIMTLYTPLSGFWIVSLRISFHFQDRNTYGLLSTSLAPSLTSPLRQTSVFLWSLVHTRFWICWHGTFYHDAYLRNRHTTLVNAWGSTTDLLVFPCGGLLLFPGRGINRFLVVK